MRCQVIQELDCFLHCSSCAIRLLACNGAESWQYRVVNCSSVVQADSDHLLNQIYLIVIQFGRVIWYDGVLCRCAINLLGCPVGAVLRVLWHLVAEALL